MTDEDDDDDDDDDVTQNKWHKNNISNQLRL